MPQPNAAVGEARDSDRVAGGAAFNAWAAADPLDRSEVSEFREHVAAQGRLGRPRRS